MYSITPLIVAVSNRDFEAAYSLIAHGADVNLGRDSILQLAWKM